MMIDTDDLINATELAEMLGLKPSAVSNTVRRRSPKAFALGFPEPITIPAVYGPLFSRQQAEEYKRRRDADAQIREAMNVLADKRKGLHIHPNG